MIRCGECQHTIRATPADLTIMSPIPARLSAAMKRLRCSHCGTKGNVKIAPVETQGEL